MDSSFSLFFYIFFVCLLLLPSNNIVVTTPELFFTHICNIWIPLITILLVSVGYDTINIYFVKGVYHMQRRMCIYIKMDGILTFRNVDTIVVYRYMGSGVTKYKIVYTTQYNPIEFSTNIYIVRKSLINSMSQYWIPNPANTIVTCSMLIS